MNKKQSLKCIDLHKKLKERINGDVFVTINNNTLTVIITVGRGIRYTRYINNLYFLNDLDKLRDEIVYDFKKWISNKFIKEVNYEIF